MANNRQDSQDSDVAFIQAMAELLADNGLSEVQVKRDYGEGESLNVRVTRAPSAPPRAPAQPVPVVAPAQPEPAAAEAAATPAADPALDPDTVTSPMVGTAYLHPEPGAAAFVSVGDEVTAGQTLLIIEAMKTMNHIPAPRAGRVTRILIDDGAPVEYGAPLIVVA